MSKLSDPILCRCFLPDGVPNSFFESWLLVPHRSLLSLRAHVCVRICQSYSYIASRQPSDRLLKIRVLDFLILVSSYPYSYNLSFLKTSSSRPSLTVSTASNNNLPPSNDKSTLPSPLPQSIELLPECPRPHPSSKTPFKIRGRNAQGPASRPMTSSSFF